MKKQVIITLSMLYAIACASILTAKNPTYQDFYITNRTKSPVIVAIAASYQDTATGKTYSDTAKVSIAPATQYKFTYRRNKFLIKNEISYSGGLDKITVNNKIYTTSITEDGNQYFTNAQQPKGFSYNSISIYPTYISYDITNLVLAS